MEKITLSRIENIPENVDSLCDFIKELEKKFLKEVLNQMPEYPKFGYFKERNFKYDDKTNTLVFNYEMEIADFNEYLDGKVDIGFEAFLKFEGKTYYILDLEKTDYQKGGITL
jgi:hypothetical protein